MVEIKTLASVPSIATDIVIGHLPVTNLQIYSNISLLWFWFCKTTHISSYRQQAIVRRQNLLQKLKV